MLTLRSSILLSAVVIALLSSSSMTTFAEGDAAVDNAMKQEAVAKPADEKAVPAKPAHKKPLHERIGAGEVGTPHNKLRDSWMKNSEQTTSQKAAEEAKRKRLEEMKGSIISREPEKKELSVSSRAKSEADLSKSQAAVAERKKSTEMPAWKKRALAAKKAREEKMAGHAAPHKADVKKVDDKKPVDVKKGEPATSASVVKEKMETTLTMPNKQAEPAKAAAPSITVTHPDVNVTEPKKAKENASTTPLTMTQHEETTIVHKPVDMNKVEVKMDADKTTVSSSAAAAPKDAPVAPLPKMSPTEKNMMKQLDEKDKASKAAAPQAANAPVASEPKADAEKSAEAKEQARLDKEMMHAQERLAAKKPGNFLDELKSKTKRVD